MKKTDSFVGGLAARFSSTLTSQKDALKNYGKPTIHPTAKIIQLEKLNSLLKGLGVENDLRIQVMDKARNATLIDDFTRAIKILSCLQEHSLQGYSANEFLKGAHFKIEDGGKLYSALEKIEGAQVRFSSHFASTRFGKEMGINCGRILPEVLFLQSKQAEGSSFSHFQAEASPWRMDKSRPWALPNRDTLQTSEHLTDSAYYFINKKVSQWLNKPVLNLGPYGWSIHDDANAITSCDYDGLVGTEEPDEAIDELVEALTRPVGNVTETVGDELGANLSVEKK